MKDSVGSSPCKQNQSKNKGKIVDKGTGRGQSRTGAAEREWLGEGQSGDIPSAGGNTPLSFSLTRTMALTPLLQSMQRLTPGTAPAVNATSLL